ncbi:MAG: hypothetical protein B7Y56_15835 [Gallionellales bacterium 35-53-114]|jgi:hypothetical protein|nr:MAG: hypothetical protein B7Y56_15835 [Gallionellales bacterium 35-53-114]HQS60029.1 hypothetical protein [Gallionellaceae bacterium]
MKLPITLQIGVLIGLLFAATLCLRNHQPEDFSRLENPNLYAMAVSKLESQPPFAKKDDLVGMVRALVESDASGIRALQGNAVLIKELGYFLLLLSFLQGLGIYSSWRLAWK